MRTAKYISITILVVLLMSLGLVYAVFNSNPFQNWLTTKLGNYLSAQFKTKISIGHINFKPLNNIELENVYFGDHKNDTLFFAGRLQFNVAGFKLDSTIFKLSDVKLTDGYCNLKFYKDGSFNIDVLDNINDPNDTLPSNGPPFVMYFDRVKISNTRLRFVDETDSTQWEDFKANDELFYGINGVAENFYIINDSLHFKVPHMELAEKSGFEVNHLEGVVTISSTQMIFDDMQIKTPTTTVGNYFSMKYDNWESFDDFYNNVKLEARIVPSQVDMRDIALFASPFKAYPYRLKLQGLAKGTVANISVDKLNAYFGETGHIVGEANFNGLPDIENTFIDAKVFSSVFSKADLEYLAQTTIAEEVSKFGNISFKGSYTGFYKDFVADGYFNTAIGIIETDLNMKLVNDYEYSGKCDLIDFNLGSLINNPLFGKLTISSNLKGNGLNFDSMTVTANALVSYLDFRGYRYQHVELQSQLDKKAIIADVNLVDPNIALQFNGKMDFSPNVPHYDFNAKVKNANIKALGIDTAELYVSLDADINFAWRDLDHNDGTIDLQRILLVKGEEEYKLNRMLLSSASISGMRSMSFQSDDITSSINGVFNFETLPSALTTSFKEAIPAYFANKASSVQAEQNFKFNTTIKTLYPFDKLFLNQVEVTNAEVRGQYNNTKQTWEVSATMGELAINKFGVRGLTLQHQKQLNQSANVSAKAKSILFGDTVFARAVDLGVKLTGNQVFAGLMVADSLSTFTTNLNGNFTLQKDSIIGLFNKSYISFRESDFIIPSLSQLAFTPAALWFNQFKVIKSDDEFIVLDGAYGFNTAHKLNADIHKVKLNLVNDLVPSVNIKLNGEVNGFLEMASTKSGDALLTADAGVTALSLDGDTLGDFKVVTNYVENESRLIAILQSLKGKLRNMKINGYYDFLHPNDALNFAINFDESDITSFQAFVKDYIKLYSGNIKANGLLTGSIKRPELNCDIDLMGVTLMVDYLKTMYSFSSSININEQLIKFSPTEIRDINDSKALLNGQIKHNNFSNFVANLSLTGCRNFQVLNTKAKDNDLFYGTAFADGALSLSGPFNDLVLDAKLTTAKGTLINIPLTSDYTDGDNGLVHIINKDTVYTNNNYKRSGSISGFAINCLLKATKDAEIQIIMDEQQGDKIRGKGSGDLKFELTRSGQFNMYGEVVIDEGDYRFTAMNLFTKKFLLNKGGTISWTGDPFSGVMNVTGLYPIKASVADVVSSATIEERRVLEQQRLPIECLLYVKGNLLTPDIKFDMNVKDLNGALSGNATSELQNTLRLWRNDNDLMTQQVISLMLFGRFAPTNLQNSTAPNGLSAGVGNTLSGFVSAQATNLVQQLIPGLNVNVDYQSGIIDPTQSRAIITAGKKWFDNRLELQASFDPLSTYQNYLTQYNLTKEGNFKIRAFSRQQPDFIFNRPITTSGMGLYYRKEFDKLPDLLKRKSKIVNNIN